MLFSRAKPKPSVDPADERIPLHFFDDTQLFKNIVTYNLLVFNDVLDPDKLRSSLERLLNRDGWRKLGGWLRKNDKGVIEYHVPKQYTAERRPVHFTHLRHDVNAADHPLASQLPRAPTDGRPGVVGDPSVLNDLICPPELDCPFSITPYLTTDRAVTGLHVVSFRDKTMVVIYLCHVVFDGVGLGQLVDAWILEMAGRGDAEVREPAGFRDDPLGPSFGLDPAAAGLHLLADKALTGWTLAAWAARNALDIAVRKKEARFVCVPAAFLKRLHAETLASLAAEARAKGEETEKPPFVSEGDVMNAWWTQMSCTDMGLDATPDRTVSVQQIVNLRRLMVSSGLVQASEDGKAPAYLGNSTVTVNALLKAREVLTWPLGRVALAFRRAIEVGRTPEQADAYLALQRQQPGRIAVLFGDPGMYMLGYSNWDQAGIFRADFSAATVTPRTTPLTADVVHCHQGPISYPEGFIIGGKDVHGNYWFSGYRSPGRWAKTEKVLEKWLSAGGAATVAASQTS